MPEKQKLTVLADRPLDVPSTLRLDPANKNYAKILAAHDEAMSKILTDTSTRSIRFLCSRQLLSKPVAFAAKTIAATAHTANN